ncbi:putative bifunctional diguanylate cyclase/phosphodiesterase [Cellulomonas sp. 179-A 4D5 NHS]|uniref:putative bifunctional diguanylate cyclase/phosphodiesterase n=1 Tax=Cellulomonas sp. 179-A 4D5 NHS TaxID=3142378 RepID=UPI0039A11B24
MDGTASTWPAALQFFLAGALAGSCVLQWVWWRGELRQAGAKWTLLWSAVLALGFVANGLLAMAPEGVLGAVLLFVRAQLFVAVVLVALPATRAYTAGPPVRRYVLAAGAFAVVRAVLWLTTDMVMTHTYVQGLPVYGPLDAATFLAPVVVVALYVVRAVGKLRITPVGVLLIASGVASVALLVASHVVQDRATAEGFATMWALPLGVGLEVLGLDRLRRAQGDAVRQNDMRDAVARIANAAWFIKDPEALLLRAREESRRLLDDPTIEGSLRPLSRGRFVTELFSVEHDAASSRERGFLMDLAQIVSAAAERHALASRLSQAAFTDSLTHLPNRHALDQHLAEALDQADVERTRVALVYCDLDGFKRANDHHGHAWGDQLLVQVADHLRSAAPYGTTVARLGGDEFVAVIPRAGTYDDLMAFGRELRAGFGGTTPEQNPPRLTVGIAVREPGDTVAPDQLLQHADTAMLEAKRTRAGVVFFGRELRSRVNAETQLRRALDEGVADGEFEAHYQPIVDTVTLEVVGLESLARWTRGGQVLMPSDWLPLAEESGLIVPIGQALLASSRAGYEKFRLPVAVNVAARQLAEPDFLKHVERSWGDGAWTHLTIEVTESALLDDSAAAAGTLAELRRRGVKIAIDDFGTGYSSLSRLATLPVDVLKIDQAFVREIRTRRGKAVLRAILALADAHGLDVVAEGVERASELTALADLGVPRVQGNLLGRASPTLPVRGPRPRPRGRRPVRVL